MERFNFSFLIRSALLGDRQAMIGPRNSQRWPYSVGAKDKGDLVRLSKEEMWKAKYHVPLNKCAAKPKIKGKSRHQKTGQEELVLEGPGINPKMRESFKED